MTGYTASKAIIEYLIKNIQSLKVCLNVFILSCITIMFSALYMLKNV